MIILKFIVSVKKIKYDDLNVKVIVEQIIILNNKKGVNMLVVDE